jgi:hypothetical protein
MKNWIKISGRLIFDLEDKTKKHEKQASWKKTAMIVFEDDLCEYYAWFLKRRYLIDLNKPLRGSHFTVINDKYDNIDLWNKVKGQYQDSLLNVYYHPDLRSNIEHWWLKAFSPQANKIRVELGMDRPYFNPHITIGLANEYNFEKSAYILKYEQLFGNHKPLKVPKLADKYYL